MKGTGNMEKTAKFVSRAFCVGYINIGPPYPIPADMRVMENVIFGTSVICGLIIIGNIFCNIYFTEQSRKARIWVWWYDFPRQTRPPRK